MDKPSVLAVLDRIDYVAWWRVLWPFTELRRRGYTCDVVMYADVRKISITKYDIILTPRVTFGGSHWLDAWLRDAKRQGKALIYDSDDDLWSEELVARQVDHEAPHGTLRAERRRILAKHEQERQQRVALLKLYDGVTVSTTPIATAISVHSTVSVEVVPNLIDVGRFERDMQRQARMIPEFTVGWAGGGRWEADFTPLAEAWKILAMRYPEVTFVVFGHAPDALTNAVPEKQLAYIEWCAIELYPAGLKNIDVGCCVLPDTPWNKSKSANKWLEHSLAGAACVVSPTVYGDVVESGYNALVANTVDDWVVHIENLIINSQMRSSIAQNARVDIKLKHNLNVGWEAWPHAWQRIASRNRMLA